MLKIKYKQKNNRPILKLQNQYKSSLIKQNKSSEPKKDDIRVNKENSFPKIEILADQTTFKQCIEKRTDSQRDLHQNNGFSRQKSRGKQQRGSIIFEKTSQKIYTRSRSQFVQQQSIIQISNEFKHFVQSNTNIMKIQNLVNEIQNKLLSLEILQQKSFYFSIKKHHLSQFLIQMLAYFIKQPFEAQLFGKEQFSFLKPTFKKLSNMIFSQKNQQKRQRLSLNSITLNQQYSRLNFQKDNIYTKTISNLLHEIQNIQVKLTSKKQMYDNIQSNCRDKFQQHKQLSQKYYNLCQDYQIQTCKIKQIKHKTAEHEQFLQKIEEEVNRMVNFNKTQLKLKVLKFINQRYKHLEDQLFSYAHELQQNNFCKLPIWDSQKFKIVQKCIWQKMEDIMKELSSTEHSQKTKIVIIAQFLQNSIQKLKQKNEQMVALFRYKTEYFTTFASKMQAWTENHSTKQLYLKTLRQQFVAQAVQIDQIFKNLQESGNKKEMSQSVQKIINKLKNIWKKRQCNYQCSTFF